MSKQTKTLSLDDLKKQVNDIGLRYPKLSEDDVFIIWFLRAYISESETAAVEALCGGSNDNDVDAVFIDGAAKYVAIVQAKYREHLLRKTEKRQDVSTFAQLAKILSSDDHEAFNEFLSDCNDATRIRLKEARKRIHNDHYRLVLFYVTPGKITPSVIKRGQQIVRESRQPTAEISFFDGKRLMTLLQDYLDGVAPPIPTLDLEMEQGKGVKVTGILQRYDTDSNIESWVFSMKGDQVGQLFDVAGLRLFARNIRGFLGEGGLVNDGISNTISKEPEHFFYYNNGVTILCERAEKSSRNGRDILKVDNPQVINGQQTTRMLHKNLSGARKASVLVKVIQVPPDSKQRDGFDDLLSQVVAGTNRQNAVTPADLMSNDRQQIEIERNLRKQGYLYLRKRQKKGEARASADNRKYIVISKTDLALAIAGCELDPAVPRDGKDNLFQEEWYTQVFPNSDPHFYLPRYWLFRAVSTKSHGFPERGYAKWMVLGFTWSQIYPLLKTKTKTEKFWTQCERNDEIMQPLLSMIDKIYIAALRFYRENRVEEELRKDISTFFRNTRGRDKKFAAFWEQKGPSITNYLAKIDSKLLYED